MYGVVCIVPVDRLRALSDSRWARLTYETCDQRGHMTRNLIYSMLTSLDGYIADEDGKFDWAVPDDEVHSFINELEQPVDTYLYGRRMYETMVAWETMHTR